MPINSTLGSSNNILQVQELSHNKDRFSSLSYEAMLKVNQYKFFLRNSAIVEFANVGIRYEV